MAISLALNGASASSMIVVPAVVALSASHGFAFAVPATFACLALVFVPMALLWVDRPARAPSAAQADARAGPAWSRAQALASPAFWSAALPFALGIAAQAGFLTHQISVLEPALPGVRAGYAVAVTGAFAVLGRVGLSFFIDAWSPRVAAAVLLALQAGALWLIGHTDQDRLLYIACAVFGLGVGNLITLPALVVQREFAPEVFGRVASLSTAVAGLTYAFAPGVLGLLRDLSGGYGVPLLACIGVELLAGVAVLVRLPNRQG
jgi:predicted MFS family arabinose efflux permease